MEQQVVCLLLAVTRRPRRAHVNAGKPHELSQSGHSTLKFTGGVAVRLNVGLNAEMDGKVAQVSAKSSWHPLHGVDYQLAPFGDAVSKLAPSHALDPPRYHKTSLYPAAKA